MLLIPKSLRPQVVHKIAADYRLKMPPLAQYAGAFGLVITVLGIALILQKGISVLSVVGVIAGIILILPLAIISFVVSRFKDIRYHIRDAIVLGVAWRGDEHVLDVGVGSGLTLFGCAKKLTHGKAVGIDIYQTNGGGGNDNIFWKNAEHEGLKERVELKIADARHMPFEDKSFDVIVSTSAFHHMGGSQAREQVAKEIVRVLKPGGRVLVYDLMPMLKELEVAMKQAGFVNMRCDGKLSALIRGDKPVE